jgi:hypothetical protein
MLVSHFFMRHKTPEPRFAPGLFVGLIASFTAIGITKPLIGLVGLGTTLLVTGVLVELNRQRIWETYRKGYKKRKAGNMWTRPNEIYYSINVIILWPLIILLGILCLMASYILA